MQTADQQRTYYINDKHHRISKIVTYMQSRTSYNYSHKIRSKNRHDNDGSERQYKT